MAKRLQSGASRAKRIAALKAERRDLQRKYEDGRQIYDSVEGLATPPVLVSFDPESGRTRLDMGDKKVFSFEGDTAERRMLVEEGWREKRAIERGAPSRTKLWGLRRGMEYIDDRLARLEAKPN